MKTNDEVIRQFFADNEAQFSSETIRSYTIALKQFFSFCDLTYDKVKAIHVRAWLADMQEQELKPRTVQLKLAAAKSFYRYCLEEHIIKKDPTTHVPTPQLEDSLPYYLDKKQLAQLMEYTMQWPRERVLVEMLYTTGVRISELLNIKQEDIKWDTQQIWIRRGKGNKERFVLFTTACGARLDEYLSTRTVDSSYLFVNPQGKPLSRVYVEQLFRKFSEAVGFKVTPHTLRHTFAAHLAEKDMPQSNIQELLGHVNINTTRIYTRLSEKARKKQYDQYNN